MARTRAACSGTFVVRPATRPRCRTGTDCGSAAAPLPGDANGDGQVDINDLTIVLSNFGSTGRAWSQGCMDGDPAGTVDINDLTIVLANFGKTYGASSGIKAVPEPTGIVLLAPLAFSPPPSGGEDKTTWSACSYATLVMAAIMGARRRARGHHTKRMKT